MKLITTKNKHINKNKNIKLLFVFQCKSVFEKKKFKKILLDHFDIKLNF
jgi:hypothetical protein